MEGGEGENWTRGRRRGGGRGSIWVDFGKFMNLYKFLFVRISLDEFSKL